jgi:hypothetical protein
MEIFTNLINRFYLLEIENSKEINKNKNTV